MLSSSLRHVALLAGLLALASCADVEDATASASVAVTDQRTNALTAVQIESINGSYTNCFGRTGSWSVAVTGSPTLANPVLSVVQGDSSCTLAISSIKTSTETLAGSIGLATSYGTAASFGSPIQFYANAMLSSVDFSGNFVLTLLFSSDPSTASGSKTASYATVSATSVTATGLAAPDYTLGLGSVTVTTDINMLTVSVTGDLTLTAGSVSGDGYKIVSGTVANTYAAIDAAYVSPSALGTIAASSLLANGVDLTSGVVRTLIVAKVANGVRSYQKFAITFNPPS